MPSRRCCCTPPCDYGCYCDNCIDDKAPCCWRVTFSGIANDTCEDCENYNKVWKLKQAEVSSAGYSCTWECYVPAVCGCGASTITLTVETDRISVTAFGAEWETETSSGGVDCCKSYALTLLSNSGDCDVSSSVVTITPSSDQNCVCSCGGSGCDFFKEDSVPTSITVFIGDIDPCDINIQSIDPCSFYANRAYVLPVGDEPGDINYGCYYGDYFADCIDEDNFGCWTFWDSISNPPRCRNVIDSNYAFSVGLAFRVSGISGCSSDPGGVSLRFVNDPYDSAPIVFARYTGCLDETNGSDNVDVPSLTLNWSLAGESHCLSCGSGGNNNKCVWPESVEL